MVAAFFYFYFVVCEIVCIFVGQLESTIIYMGRRAHSSKAERRNFFARVLVRVQLCYPHPFLNTDMKINIPAPPSEIMDKITEITNKIDLQLTEHSTAFPDIVYKDFRELVELLFDYDKLKWFINYVHYCKIVKQLNDETNE
jgi:hypothetical protein